MNQHNYELSSADAVAPISVHLGIEPSLRRCAYGTWGVYTVRYEAVNAMLLNEFLKEHHKIEDQDCRIEQQEATNTELKQRVQALTAQVEVSKSVPQTVQNNQ